MLAERKHSGQNPESTWDRIQRLSRTESRQYLGQNPGNTRVEPREHQGRIQRLSRAEFREPQGRIPGTFKAEARENPGQNPESTWGRIQKTPR